MAILELIDSAIDLLQRAKVEMLLPSEESKRTTETAQAPEGSEARKIAWGSKVSPTFKARVLWIADSLGCDPSDLMACMAWESGETFSPSIMNAAGSGAVGLIQFMPSTCKNLGVVNIKALSAEDQLRYVYEYFKPLAGRLHNLGDVYMTILWPKAVGQPDHFVLFDRAKTPTTFRQNSGLDVNKDGLVTRAECLVKVNQKLAKGLQEGYIG